MRTKSPDIEIGTPPVVPVGRIHEWYDLHGPAVLGLALHLVGDADRAESITIDVFLVARERGGGWDDDSCACCLLRLTRHVAAGYPASQAGGWPPTTLAGAGLASRWPLSRITPDERELIEATFVEGCTISELATRQAVSTSEAARSLRVAVADLAAVVDPPEGHHAAGW